VVQKLQRALGEAVTLEILFLNDAPVIRLGLASGFEDLGHRVTYFPQHLWLLTKDAQILCVQDWLRVHTAPDIVIFEGFTGDRPIFPEAVALFKARESRFYYWAIEDPLWTREVIGFDGGSFGPYALIADHIFTTAIECVSRYVSRERSSSVLQFGMNPHFHRPVDIDPALTADVVLIANYYQHRTATLVEHMIYPAMEVARSLGLLFHLYGYGWNNWSPLSGYDDPRRGPLNYEALPVVYSGAKIALGAEQCLNASDTQSSMRVFEAMGCGICYLGPRHRAHERMFRENEIALSDSPRSSMDHLLRLLTNEHARIEMAAAGRQRCLMEHRYELRARQVLQVFERSRSRTKIADKTTSEDQL
jgi:spore maturation protein CgeB